MYIYIYMYVYIYISQSIVKYVVSQTNFQLPVSKVPTDLGPLHCSNTICCLITTGQWSVRAASRYLKVSRIPTDLSNPKPNRTPTKQTHHGTRSQKFETCPTIQWIGLKEILQDRTLWHHGFLPLNSRLSTFNGCLFPSTLGTIDLHQGKSPKGWGPGYNPGPGVACWCPATTSKPASRTHFRTRSMLRS